MPTTTALAPAVSDRSQLGGPGYRTWREQTEALGGCAHPIRLSGTWTLHDQQSGHELASRAGNIMIACGNRRASVCPACSDRYAADAFHLLRAGLAGGTKGIPETVADKPRLFVTLTAPSFGPVHNHRTSKTGNRLPCGCGSFHHEHDPALGQPLDPESYDYTGHVLWQALAGELWGRFTTALQRHLSRAGNLRVRDFATHARLSFAKVAEYQRRGTIHFHAVIRLDGPDGPADPAPAWADVDTLTDAVHAAHATARRPGPTVAGRAFTATWGRQIDIRPIHAEGAHQVENEHGVITDDRLASYIAKYATKGTSTTEAADRPIRSRAQIEQLTANPHHKRLIRTAWDLAAPVACPACHPHGPHEPEGCGCELQHCHTCDNGGLVTRTTHRDHTHPEQAGKPDPLDRLHLRRWAHMLGFRGHFLSKSRAYSVPFGRIRGDRQQHRHEAALAELGITDDTEITVINDWQPTHFGHPSPEHRDLALAIAERTREARKTRHTNERKD